MRTYEVIPEEIMKEKIDQQIKTVENLTKGFRLFKTALKILYWGGLIAVGLWSLVALSYLIKLWL